MTEPTNLLNSLLPKVAVRSRGTEVILRVFELCSAVATWRNPFNPEGCEDELTAALQGIDQCLTIEEDDCFKPNLHTARALAQFGLGKTPEAAASLNAAISSVDNQIRNRVGFGQDKTVHLMWLLARQTDLLEVAQDWTALESTLDRLLFKAKRQDPARIFHALQGNPDDGKQSGTGHNFLACFSPDHPKSSLRELWARLANACCKQGKLLKYLKAYDLYRSLTASGVQLDAMQVAQYDVCAQRESEQDDEPDEPMSDAWRDRHY